jgi:predicted nucleic acid-binding protein
MASGKPIYYWDAVCLIAWITDERRSNPADMEGLAEVTELVDSSKAIIMTSVLWRAEVLNGSMTQAQRKRLEEVFDPRSIVEVGIDSRVMELAGEIRNFHRNSTKKDVMKNIRVPDAIHLASAIIYNATEFHTFDGAGASGNNSKLLTLDGNVAGHRLRICIPKSTQGSLDLKPSEPE